MKEMMRKMRKKNDMSEKRTTKNTPELVKLMRGRNRETGTSGR